MPRSPIAHPFAGKRMSNPGAKLGHVGFAAANPCENGTYAVVFRREPPSILPAVTIRVKLG